MSSKKEELIKILSQFVSSPEKYVLETESAFLVNCSPHELKFTDGSVLEGSLELAKILKASPKETPILSIKPAITIVKTEFTTTSEGEQLVAMIRDFNKKSSKPVLLISSIISINAYKFPVVSPIVTKETSRLPPDQRIVHIDKFNSLL